MDFGGWEGHHVVGPDRLGLNVWEWHADSAGHFGRQLFRFQVHQRAATCLCRTSHIVCRKISWYKKAASIWNVRLMFFYTVQVKEYHRTTTNQYLQDHKLVIIFIFSLNPNLCIFFLVKSLFLHLLMVNTCEHPYFSWVSMKIPHGNPVETHESPMTHHERSPRNPIRSLNHRQKSIKHH